MKNKRKVQLIDCLFNFSHYIFVFLFNEIVFDTILINVKIFAQPTFQVPQTLCIQDTLEITHLKNQLANSYQWQLTGPNNYEQTFDNENIELRMLEVYNRWGARVYRQLGGRLRWDGRVEGNPAGAGTYVVRAVYVEVHTGEEVEVAQDVALLR